jgi:hypothetical protein
MATIAQIKSPAVVDSRIVTGRSLPVGGARLYYELKDGAQSEGKIKNLVNPSLPALILGTPVYAADGITFGGGPGGAGLDTQLAEVADWTVLAICRPITSEATAAGRALVYGNYSSNGSALIFNGPVSSQPSPNGTVRAASTFSSLVTATTANDANVLRWLLMGGSAASGVGMAAYNETAGLTGNGASAAARVPATGRTIKIGVADTSIYAGFVKMVNIAEFPFLLTPTQRATMAAFLRERALDFAGVSGA